MGRVATPARVKNENGKESDGTKAIQFRTLETFAPGTCIVAASRRCRNGDGHF
jgi:hypothetical protein